MIELLYTQEAAKRESSLIVLMHTKLESCLVVQESSYLVEICRRVRKKELVIEI